MGPAPLYILTDATGYVTCCFAAHRDLREESARRPLLAPIRVAHWATGRTDVGTHGGQPKWKLVEEFLWP